MRIVGLTGPNAAGKGEVANILRARGYLYHSLSDVVRDEATLRGLDHTRENLIRVGNELRAAHGPGALAERIVAKIVGAAGAVPEERRSGSSPWLIQAPAGVSAIVDSIRNPAEVAVLRRLAGFILVGVNAPIAVRFARSRLRARAGDGTTLEEFARKESLENSTDPAAQQLTQTFMLADVVIDNSGTLGDLGAKVAAALPSV
jgi:dephospho-CoA kinase